MLLILHQRLNFLDYLAGLGGLQRRDPRGCTRICPDCYSEMCSALADCIPSRCYGELDRLHVNPYGNWLKLVDEQNGGYFFPHISIRHAWLGALDCKFVFSTSGYDAWWENDSDGILDEESTARYSRKHRRRRCLRRALLLVHSRIIVGSQHETKVNFRTKKLLDRNENFTMKTLCAGIDIILQ